MLSNTCLTKFLDIRCLFLICKRLAKLIGIVSAGAQRPVESCTLMYVYCELLQEAVAQQQPQTLLAPAHLLAILLTEDKAQGTATAFVRNVHEAGETLTDLTLMFPVPVPSCC